MNEYIALLLMLL